MRRCGARQRASDAAPQSPTHVILKVDKDAVLPPPRLALAHDNGRVHCGRRGKREARGRGEARAAARSAPDGLERQTHCLCARVREPAMRRDACCGQRTLLAQLRLALLHRGQHKVAHARGGQAAERGRGQASSGGRRNAARGSTRAAAVRRKVERRSPRVRQAGAARGAGRARRRKASAAQPRTGSGARQWRPRR